MSKRKIHKRRKVKPLHKAVRKRPNKKPMTKRRIKRRLKDVKTLRRYFATRQEEAKPVERVVQIKRQVLSPLENRLLTELSVADIPITAQHLGMSVGTLHVHLYRIRKKYKEARAFVNKIDSLRQREPKLRPYLKTRETE